jgi:hypothetical protein
LPHSAVQASAIGRAPVLQPQARRAPPRRHASCAENFARGSARPHSQPRTAHVHPGSWRGVSVRRAEPTAPLPRKKSLQCSTPANSLKTSGKSPREVRRGGSMERYQYCWKQRLSAPHIRKEGERFTLCRHGGPFELVSDFELPSAMRPPQLDPCPSCNETFKQLLASQRTRT